MNRACLRIAAAAIAMLSGLNCGGGVTQPSRVPGLSITAVTPTSGPASGGTAVTVSGHNFTQSVVVRFGSAHASVQYERPNRIIAFTPPHAAGTVDVTVAVGGTSTSLSNAFTYIN